MNKLMKIPLWLPFAGMIIGIVFLIIVASMPNTALLIAGLILLHISAWIVGAKFLLCGFGFFSSVLSSK